MKVYRIFFWITCLLITVEMAYSQNNRAVHEADSTFQARVKLSRINDVYIPTDTKDAIKELYRLTQEEARLKMLKVPEDTIASKLHFSLGRWMQINWGFDEGSRLSAYFIKNKVTFVDDMVDLLLRAFYRDIKGIPIDEANLMKAYSKVRKEQMDRELQNKPLIHTEKRIRLPGAK
ncbi:MAG: hypothetical protein IPM86_03370 [Saprospiraceae bacterium]|nr:hypothetical protein [Saprospiraceae bacterium]